MYFYFSFLPSKLDFTLQGQYHKIKCIVLVFIVLTILLIEDLNTFYLVVFNNIHINNQIYALLSRMLSKFVCRFTHYCTVYTLHRLRVEGWGKLYCKSVRLLTVYMYVMLEFFYFSLFFIDFDGFPHFCILLTSYSQKEWAQKHSRDNCSPKA